MARAKGKVVAKVTKGKNRAPVKAGRNMPKNIGGIANAKVVATARKIKNHG